jgi:YbbR domain-containing protein
VDSKCDNLGKKIMKTDGLTVANRNEMIQNSEILNFTMTQKFQEAVKRSTQMQSEMNVRTSDLKGFVDKKNLEFV